jgi:hypothetical protein
MKLTSQVRTGSRFDNVSWKSNEFVYSAMFARTAEKKDLNSIYTIGLTSD